MISAFCEAISSLRLATVGLADDHVDISDYFCETSVLQREFVAARLQQAEVVSSVRPACG